MNQDSERPRLTLCQCGHIIALTRDMQQIGRLVTCPVCGHETRVWKLIVRSNREGIA